MARQAWAQGGGAPTTPQALNRYAYAQNAPLRCTDPTGHWIERAVDIAFIAYDIWDIPQNGLTWDNGLALAADVGGLLLPGLTGGGMLVRAAAHADDVADAARAAAQGGEAAADTARAATQGGEAARRSAARRLRNCRRHVSTWLPILKSTRPCMPNWP